jgi:hypothetical protein
MKFTIASVALAAVGLLFMDDADSKQNRLERRYNATQIQDMIIAINHLNSPMPWELD